MDLKLEYHGDAFVEFSVTALKAVGSYVTIENLSLETSVRVVFKPLNNFIPFVGGVQVISGGALCGFAI